LKPQERAALTIVNRILSDLVRVDIKLLTQETPLVSLPTWNSNCMATAIVMLEKSLGRRFVDDALDNVVTIGDFAKWVVSTPGAHAAPQTAVNPFAHFDSLGDSCEFGFVQQEKGIVRPHLLRFSSFQGTPEERLQRLIFALTDDFARLAEPELLELYVPEDEWDGGEKEYRIVNRHYGWQIHTSLLVKGTSEEAARGKLRDFPASITFLRDQFLHALAQGRQSWIWKSAKPPTIETMETLFALLQKFGPNSLFWVLPADVEHEPQTFLTLQERFFKAYIWKSQEPWAGDWSNANAWTDFLNAAQSFAPAKRDTASNLPRAVFADDDAKLEKARRLLTAVAADQLERPSLQLTDTMTPADVYGWDSLKHIRIVLEVERRIGRNFSQSSLDEMQKIGDFVRLIAEG
jgi:acyl carrier protein